MVLEENVRVSGVSLPAQRGGKPGSGFYTVDSMPYASTRAGGKPGGTHTWMTHTETIKKLFRLLDDGETLYAIHSK